MRKGPAAALARSFDRSLGVNGKVEFDVILHALSGVVSEETWWC